MAKTLKIIIPMAGWGTRMRPHTYSKPKPLVSVAGKAALEHLLDMFLTAPDAKNAEYVFIVGPFLGEMQVPVFIKEKYPSMKASYVVQAEMKGQSHALWLAREHLHGPMIMCFADTLMDADFSRLGEEKADVVAWVMPVEDPRRFGVAEVGADGWVRRLIEKPATMENNLALVGCYYFKDAASLLAAIDEQMKRGAMLKNEYFLADAISILIERGAKMRTEKISTWLDTGTIDATLNTNRVLLERGAANEMESRKSGGVQIIAPSFIHASAQIEDSTIGPFASIGAECRINDSHIEDSIIEAGCEIRSAWLSRSLVGEQAKVEGRGDGQTMRLNVGDHSQVSV